VVPDTVDHDVLAAIAWAREVVASSSPICLGEDELRRRLPDLKGGKEWWLARQVLRRAARTDYVRQQLALCTYKDPELRRADALDRAGLILLGRLDVDPGDVDDPEDAGLAGAIAKRRWELDGREEHLRTALRWYDRAAALNRAKAAEGPAPLDPYGHVNAAFVRDLLAHEFAPGGAKADADGVGVTLHAAARLLRDEVVAAAPHGLAEWWRRASLLETHVGRRDLPAAKALLNEPAALANVAEWERESTATQVVALAGVLDPPIPEDDLVPLLGSLLRVDELPTGAARTLNRRFGVAMSGGGFRATLFHLGVLARLADEGLLHQVQVMSTVSGGSIAGAAYFADLAHRLRRPGGTADDERCELQRLIDTVVDVVSSTNLRVQAFFGPRTLLAARRRRRLSRTQRLGLLLEERLLGPLRPDEQRRDLGWLRVVPRDEPASFSPKRDNWRRTTKPKVPVLLVNATSLGTGRSWRFTGSWMGEPELLADDGLDPVTRLDPLWYDRAPGAERRVAIGDAVAASAAVPGLFPPLQVRGLYDGRVVTLVDGGVHDNQGVSGLLDQDCTDLFVSDASGLMAERKQARRGLASVLLRTNSIFMATVRLATFAEAGEAALGGRVRDHRAVHLLDGVVPERIAPTVPGAAPPEHDDVATTTEAVPADDAVDRAVQRALAELRTDLDRFTPAECFALMELGYRLTSRSLRRSPHPLAQPPTAPYPWSFRVAGAWMAPSTPRARELARSLRRGRPVFGKWLPGRRRTLEELSP
jgi:predicted acylesterase/phospholipase RssA